MKFSIKVQPSIFEEQNLNLLRYKLRHSFSDLTFTISSSFGTGLHSERVGIVRVFNIEKHRPKKEYTGRKHDGLKGKVRNTKIVKRGHSIAYVYDFKVDMLKMLGLKVKQGSRTFKIIDKQGKEYSVSEFSNL